MQWDFVKQSLRSDHDLALLHAFEHGSPIDFENILFHDRASYFELAALSMGFERPDLIQQLQTLHKRYAYWGEYRLPKTMGSWFEPHEIEKFSALFDVHQTTHWFGVAERMIEERCNEQLNALLQLKNPTGQQVMNPKRSKSFLLWMSAGCGNQDAFHMLLPHSRVSDEGYRCFIAAVYNNHNEIADDIINDCLAHNTINDLMAGVRLFAQEKFYDHNQQEDEKVREMVARIQRGKISASVEPGCKSQSRKI